MSLSLDNVGVTYGERQALASVSIEMAPGLIGVIGPNGAGKSTLLKSIAGLTERTGNISVDSLELKNQPTDVVAKIVAYCSQSSFPVWPITVREVVSLGRLPFRNDGDARAQDSAAVDSALQRMTLQALAQRRIDTLSGGERSRALLARTLATRARVLLVDEPTADLDPYHELRTLEALRDEAAQGVIVVAVLHNLTLAARFCDRLIVIENGALRANGRPEDVLTNDLLRSVYSVDAYVASHEESALVIPWRRLDQTD